MPHRQLRRLLQLLLLSSAPAILGVADGRAQTVVIEGPPIERTMVRDPAGREAFKTGTGRIAGRVVAADTGAPIRRADVQLTAPETGVKLARTDQEGRFDFRDLPAGRYSLGASRPGYVSVQYGQRRAFEPGRPIELADKQVVPRADIAMPRGGVIAGRITDEFGEPVAEAMISVMRRSWANGRRRLMPAGRTAQTNDLGQYRVYGLPPGEYYVSGSVRGLERPMAGPGPGPASTALPPGFETGYAQTYFPGAAGPAGAQAVTVAIAQEAQNTDFALLPVRLARVSGTVIGSEGKPLGSAMVVARPVEAAGIGLGMPPGRPTGPDGRFDIPGLAPGDYILQAHQVQVMTSDDGNATMVTRIVGGPGGERESASMPLAVTGEDLTGLVIVTSKGATASGRIRFDGEAPPPASSVRILAMPHESDGGPTFNSPGPVKPDATFRLSGLLGRQSVRVIGLPPAWRVEAIRLDGEDVTDAGIDFKPGSDATDIEITVTSKLTEVSGTVTAANGNPIKDYTVVVFSDSPDHWVVPFTRWVGTSRPDQDGRFRVRSLPPGSYQAVALEYIEQGAWGDPELLERLRVRGKRVTLGAGSPAALVLELTTAF